MIGGDGDDYFLGGPGDDRYLLDGLGHDWVDDTEGVNVARCALGVRVVDHSPDLNTGEHVLTFESGGTLTYYEGELISILGCGITL